MDTEQIMEIAEDYADAAADHAHECSTPNELTLLLNRRAALQVAIEALVQERDVLKHRSEHLASALTDEQSKSDKLEIKLVDAAAERKVLRDALGAEPVAWGVFHEDGSAHIYQQKEAADIFGVAVPLILKVKHGR